MTTISQSLPLGCVAGVDTDNTPFQTQHYAFSQNVEFDNGLPQKISGWNEQQFDGSPVIEGKVRSIFSTTFANRVQTVIGTHKKFYSVSGSSLTNVTPTGNPITIANSLSTLYETLANNPIATTNGSSIITITDATGGPKLIVGDVVRFTGAASVGGISNTLINNVIFLIRSKLTSTTYTVVVGGNATSTTTGGGAAVIRTTGLITVVATAHGQSNGDRVSITDATNTGGILAVDINRDFNIRNSATNAFDVMTDSFATSSVTLSGGANTDYAPEIPDGQENEVSAQGYGMGMYGDGLYGTALLSQSGRTLPRIWFVDKFGDTIITTPGNGTPVYRWDGSTTNSPIPVPNSPAQVNYAFISDNILVTFGAGGVSNKIFASDQNDIEQWVSSATNQVFEDNVEGAGRLLSHANVNGVNLIWTEQKVYTFRYIGLPNVWQIKPLEPIGIIAPMARVVVNGIIVWMGLENFYMWRGGNVEIVKSNSRAESTIKNYVFDDLNYSQKSKCFGWYNEKKGQIWFHYPSANSNEPDRVAVMNVKDYTWWPLEMDRTAGEYPETNLSVPRLATPDSKIYRHESGFNDVDQPLPWTLMFNKRSQPKVGKANIKAMAVVPDSIQTGNINMHMDSWQYPQSSIKMYNNDYTVTPTTENMQVSISGKVYQYILSGSQLDQEWRMGQWSEDLQAEGISP